MIWFEDLYRRKIRFTDERKSHIENNHPEMQGQFDKIQETLLKPDCIVISNIDREVNLYYKLYFVTPVTEKFLCVVVRILQNDFFIITSYFTDTMKKGEVIWQKK